MVANLKVWTMYAIHVDNLYLLSCILKKYYVINVTSFCKVYQHAIHFYDIVGMDLWTKQEFVIFQYCFLYKFTFGCRSDLHKLHGSWMPLHDPRLADFGLSKEKRQRSFHHLSLFDQFPSLFRQKWKSC